MTAGPASDTSCKSARTSRASGISATSRTTPTRLCAQLATLTRSRKPSTRCSRTWRRTSHDVRAGRRHPAHYPHTSLRVQLLDAVLVVRASHAELHGRPPRVLLRQPPVRPPPLPYHFPPRSTPTEVGGLRGSTKAGQGSEQKANCPSSSRAAEA